MRVLTVVVLLAATVACGAIGGGKPSTSAPGGSDLMEVQDACWERQDAINEWLDERLDANTQDVIDGKLNLLQAAVKAEDLEKEAEVMRDELTANCQRRLDELWEQ